MHLRRHVFAIVLIMLQFVLLSVSAVTQTPDTPANLGGRYRVVGTNPDGGQYTGTLEVKPRGGIYQFRWTAGAPYEGVGVRNGKMVAVAFAIGNDGTGCGVVDYTVLTDGTLQGKWGYWGTTGSGTERARRLNGTGLPGDYAATGSNPDGTRYQVNIAVRQAGRGYIFVWSNKTEGFGIRTGDNVAVGIGGERCGFVSYEVRADGSLEGVWGGYGSQQIGTERATKQ